MNAIRIRRARVEDAAGIAKVHVQSWNETYPGIIPQDIIDGMSVEAKCAEWAINLLEGPPHHRFTFVAVDPEDSVVGFAAGGALRKNLFAGDESLQKSLEAYDGELQAIYMLRDFHGRGLGRRLFSEVSNELVRRGHRNLLVRVLKDNPTRGFYERMGGTLVGMNRIKIGEWLEELIYGWEKL